MLDIDLYAFERDLQAFDRELGEDLLGVGDDLAKQAEADARQRLETLVYSTPQRGGYERTRMLIDSVQGSTAPTPTGVEVTLEAVGGNGGRQYAAANETGTRARYVPLETLLREARADPDPLGMRPYERGPGGLEPRPYVAPAMARAEDELPEVVLEAVSKAWGL